MLDVVFRLLLTTAVVAVLGCFAAAEQPISPTALREHPAIAYSRSSPNDPIALLNARLQKGDVTLEHDVRSGYLDAVLAALQVPASSQVLVFSKTSFQAARIHPRNPRALYFNDTVAVGWVPGGEVLEFAAQDPRLGTIFYTLEQSTSDGPRFTRNAACVQCHTSEATLDVPGMFAASVYPDANGTAQYSLLYSTDHRTPFDMRWGGWYVTGGHQGHHLGNAVSTDPNDANPVVTPATLHPARLDDRFDTAAYPQPSSDIVALLVMEHQMRMLNLMTRVGWEARVGEAVAGRPLQKGIDELVDYLLFVDEATLPGPITGASAFASHFANEAPRDRAGRSLKDLDLRTRLFRYPCSYLIYSAPFDGLPTEVRERVFARAFEILSGGEASRRYASLDPASRRAVLEILRETKPEFARATSGTIDQAER
jgi:hypothetical protein